VSKVTESRSDLPAASDVFDGVNGEFDARLRRITTTSRTARSGDREITVTNAVAIVETRFSYASLDRLYYPNFVAIERKVGPGTAYLIFEIVSVNPMHFQMLGMDVSMPTVLRKEYLDTINQSWGKSQETWIDLAAVPTWYMMSVSGEETRFEHSRFMPLSGSKVHLLSRKTVEKFLCFEQGETVGSMVGFELPLTVNLASLVRYHCGMFGFTGSGKSNLTSTLVRKAMRRDPDLTVVVFDVSGEYATHLIDILEAQGNLLSTEPLENEEQLANSQALPESLEESTELEAIRAAFAKVFRQGRVRGLSLAGGVSFLDLSAVESLLEKTVEEGKTGSVAARIALENFVKKFYHELELHPSVRLSTLGEGARDALVGQLMALRDGTHEKSGLRSEVQVLLEYIEGSKGESGEVESGELTPESIARDLAYEKAPRLSIIYVPEPELARLTARRLIDRLLYLRKHGASRKRILFVFDEAQEYIPDNPRERDGTLDSNRAVEALLRQGRKYRLHCWLATQRVAHLNVSALQQLHSYFVSTLPRFYDRMVIADSFGLPYEVMERSAQLDTGEWLFVSFKAAKQKNVPVFVKTENNEDVLTRYLAGRR
jgi:hypothetical protein